MPTPEPITVPALAATLTRRVTDDLIAALRAMPDDRLAWSPGDTGGEGRSALEQAKECTLVNLIWAVTLRERGLPEGGDPPPEFLALAAQPLDTRESAVAALERTTADLVAAIEGVRHEETGVRVRTATVGNGTLTLAECCLYPYWHMVFHEGQINYLQTLYGDKEDRHEYHMDGDGDAGGATP